MDKYLGNNSGPKQNCYCHFKGGHNGELHMLLSTFTEVKIRIGGMKTEEPLSSLLCVNHGAAEQNSGGVDKRELLTISPPDGLGFCIRRSRSWRHELSVELCKFERVHKVLVINYDHAFCEHHMH